MALHQPDRKQTMKDMRHKQLMSLQEIADQYGISRERVRQIIGNSGKGYKTQRQINIVRGNADKTNSELKALLGIGVSGRYARVRAEARHPIEGGQAALGKIGEDVVSQKLHDNGIKHRQMPHHHPFDILLDGGKKVEVKTAFSEFVSNPKQKSTQYRFGVGKNKKGNFCDFFICYIEPTGDFFIIPNKKIGMIDSLYITWPTQARSWAGWEEYHNRWDLLK